MLRWLSPGLFSCSIKSSESYRIKQFITSYRKFDFLCNCTGKCHLRKNKSHCMRSRDPVCSDYRVVKLEPVLLETDLYLLTNFLFLKNTFVICLCLLCVQNTVWPNSDRKHFLVTWKDKQQTHQAHNVPDTGEHVLKHHATAYNVDRNCTSFACSKIVSRILC